MTVQYGKLYIKDSNGNPVQFVPEGAVDIPAYTGATSSASGVAGLVPAASSADKDKYLKGDGTWAEQKDVLVTQLPPTQAQLAALDNNALIFYAENELDGQAYYPTALTLAENQVITGIKTIANKYEDSPTNNPGCYSSSLNIRLPDVVKGTAPETPTYGNINFLDSVGSGIEYEGRLGFVEHTKGSDGGNYTWMACVKSDEQTSTRTYAGIRVGYTNTGEAYAMAPATSATRTVSTDIITRGFLNGSDSGVVHTTGTESIEGKKLIKGSLRIVGNTPQYGIINHSATIGSTAPAANANSYIYFFDDVADDTADSLGLNHVLCYIQQQLDTSNNSKIILGAYNTTTRSNRAVLFGATATDNGAAMYPMTNNLYALGLASYRWGNIYSGAAVNVSSDERMKQQINGIPDEVLDAWGDVNWCQYKFNASVEEKGDAARMHTGLIAQRIDEAFTEHDLDAREYGLFCYDEWDEVPAEYDENGNVTNDAREAGNTYSVRYEEALAMEAAYQRRRADQLQDEVDDLKRRMAALEEKIQ